MKERHWLLPAVVSAIVILLLAAGAVMVLRPKAEELTGARIAVNDEVALRHVATLSTKNNSYSMGSRGLMDSLWMRIPESVRTRFPLIRRPATPFEVKYSSIDPGDVRLIMLVEYPKEWLRSLKDHEIREKIDKAIEAAGMKYVRAASGEGSYTSPVSIYVTQGSADYDPRGRLLNSRPYINAAIDGLPFYTERMKLEFLSEWDGKSTVTEGFVFDNPYYHKPDPLPEADPLPQTVAEGDVEVTLRAVVTKVTDDNHLGFRQRKGVMHVTSGSDGMEMPLSQPLPPEFFPRAKGNAQDPYYSTVLFEVKQKGRSEPEWGISGLDVFYDKALHEFGINGWSSRGLMDVTFLTFAGDVAALGNSVKVVAKLKRKDNYPPDELQVVELPLPGDGEAVTPGVKVGLWDTSLVVNQVAWNMAGASNEFIAPKAGRLSVLFETKGGNAALREAFLVKDDGTTASLEHSRASSGSSNYRSVYHYDLSRTAGWQQDSKPLVYDDYSSISLQFISPREYPSKFEFYARPVEAAGKWEAEN